jgi:hypothetical protein
LSLWRRSDCNRSNNKSFYADRLPCAHARCHPLSLPWAPVFGSLINPTDAVLGTSKNVDVRPSLEVEAQGEGDVTLNRPERKQTLAGGVRLPHRYWQAPFPIEIAES